MDKGAWQLQSMALSESNTTEGLKITVSYKLAPPQKPLLCPISGESAQELPGVSLFQIIQISEQMPPPQKAFLTALISPPTCCLLTAPISI